MELDLHSATYIFAPLEQVDLRSLDEIAEKLRCSRTRQERVVGNFLKRIVNCRTHRPAPVRPAGPATGAARQPARIQPRPADRFEWTCGLHSLRGR